MTAASRSSPEEAPIMRIVWPLKDREGGRVTMGAGIGLRNVEIMLQIRARSPILFSWCWWVWYEWYEWFWFDGWGEVRAGGYMMWLHSAARLRKPRSRFLAEIERRTFYLSVPLNDSWIMPGLAVELSYKYRSSHKGVKELLEFKKMCHKIQEKGGLL